MFIVDAPVRFKAGPKIPTARDASKHKAGGGDVKIGTLGVISIFSFIPLHSFIIIL
jgi:hypothetical protein